MDVAFFRTHVLTKGLSHAELERLQNHLTESEFQPGEKLLAEGTATNGLFIVVEGQVRVMKKDPGGNDREITELEGPTVLGELELISDEAGMATVQAVSAVSALVLSTEAFETLVNEGDSVASKITRNIARVVIHRLSETNTRMVALFALMNT
jgi:CRP-like cAMP-binding protein